MGDTAIRGQTFCPRRTQPPTERADLPKDGTEIGGSQSTVHGNWKTVFNVFNWLEVGGVAMRHKTNARLRHHPSKNDRTHHVKRASDVGRRDVQRLVP